MIVRRIEALTNLTLCIPTYNRLSELKTLLNSLEKDIPYFNELNICIVDDGSTDQTSSYIKETYPFIDLLTLNHNSGPAIARNQAIKNCPTEFIAFFDSDVVISPSWFEKVPQRLHPNTIVSGKVVRPDGSLEWGARRSTFLGGSLRTSEKRANVASSNNMIIPIALAKKIGGFNEKFFIYFEDSEFCIRARMDAGVKVIYAPDIVVIHHHQSKYNPKRERLFWRNKMLGMLDLSNKRWERFSICFLNFFIVFIHMRHPSSFLPALVGYFRGIRDHFKYRYENK